MYMLQSTVLYLKNGGIHVILCTVQCNFEKTLWYTHVYKVYYNKAQKTKRLS